VLLARAEDAGSLEASREETLLLAGELCSAARARGEVAVAQAQLKLVARAGSLRREVRGGEAERRSGGGERKGR